MGLEIGNKLKRHDNHNELEEKEESKKANSNITIDTVRYEIIREFSDENFPMAFKFCG